MSVFTFNIRKFLIINIIELLGNIVISQKCQAGYELLNNSCLACSKEYYNLNESPFLALPFSRNECIPREISKQKIEIFVSETACSNLSICDGSKEHPMDNILQALNEINKIAKMYSSLVVNLFLLGKEFFILEKDAALSLKYYFRRVSVNISIEPFFCSKEEIIGCLSGLNEYTIINIKISSFFFFVSGKFQIRNIIFKGNDLHLQASNHFCSNQRMTCCSFQELIFDQTSETCSYFSKKNRTSSKDPWGLFNIELLEEINTSLYDLPELVLVNCRFEIINSFKVFDPSFDILIQSINSNFFALTIINMTISYSFFAAGILKLEGDKYSDPSLEKFSANPFIGLRNLLLEEYDFFLLRNQNDNLFSIQRFFGEIVISEVSIEDLKNPQEGESPLIFYFSKVMQTISLFNILISNSSGYAFMSASLSGAIKIESVTIIQSVLFAENESKAGSFLYLSNIPAALINNLFIIECVFTSIFNAKFSAFKFFNIKDALTFNNTFVENTININFLFSNASVVFSLTTMFMVNNNNILLISTDSSVTFTRFSLLFFQTEIENIIVMESNPLSSGYAFQLLDSQYKSIFFNNLNGYNSMLVWSVPSDNDIIIVNNFSISNCTTLNDVKEDFIFFEAFYFKTLAFNQIEYSNFKRRRFTLLSLYDFEHVSFSNSSFVNVEENLYYFIAVECKLCLFEFSNILMENLTFFFDTFYFKLPIGIYENITFKNISKIEYRVYAIFWFEAHENCSIRQMNFISSSNSEKNRFLYWNTHFYCLLYFINNIFVKTEEASFIILDSNLNFRDNYIIISFKNKFFSVKDLYAQNFYCDSDFASNIQFQNGILAFFSSDTYLKGTDTQSVVNLSQITISECKNCKNGVIGFVNVQNISIVGLHVFNSSSINGGAVSIIFAEFLVVNKASFFNSKAFSFGGAYYLKGIAQIILRNCLFNQTEASSGGAIYSIDNTNFLIEESFFLYSSSYKEGGVLFVLRSNVQLRKGSFYCTRAKGEGGGIFVKYGEISIDFGFISDDSQSSFGGFLYIEFASLLEMKGISFKNSQALEKGIIMLIYDCPVVNIEEVSFLNTGSGTFGYGTIVIENQLVGSTYSLVNIYCFKNQALDSSFLLFTSSVNILLANITISNSPGSLINMLSPQSQNSYITSKVYCLNFTIFSEKINSEEGRDVSLFKFENLNIFLKSFAFHGESFDTNFFFSIIGCRISINYFYISAKQSLLLSTSPFLFNFRLTNAFFEKIYFLRSSNRGFIQSSESNLTIWSVLLFNCKTKGDSFFLLSLGWIEIGASAFIQNEGLSGGVFKLSSLSALMHFNYFIRNKVLDCIVSNVTGYEVLFNGLVNDILIFNNQEQLRASIFSNNLFLLLDGVSIGVEGTSAIINNSMFIKSSLADTKILKQPKAVWALNSNLTIKLSLFSQLYSELGGALRLENKIFKEFIQFLDFFENLFVHCTSDYAGVFYISGYIKVNISNNIFKNNKAITLDDRKGSNDCANNDFNLLYGKTIIMRTAENMDLSGKNKKTSNSSNQRGKSGMGGVGILLCQYCKEVNFNLFLNVFENNWADNFFPTIFSDSKITDNQRPQVYSENQFLNNFDKFNLTTKIFNLPLKFLFTEGHMESNFMSRRYFDPKETITIVSGAAFELAIMVADDLNQLLSYDYSSTVFLSELINNSSRNIFYLSESINHASGGIFNFSSLLIKAHPNKTFKVLLQFKINLNTIFPFLNYELPLDPIGLNIFSRPCIPGEIFKESDQSCFKCPPGKYSLIDPMNQTFQNQKCLNCLQNALCSGGKVLSPNSGYWRYSARSDILVECPSKISCLGNRNGFLSEEELRHGKCIERSSGVLCYTCDAGYARFSSSDVCKSCNLEVIVYIKFALILVGFTGYIIFQVRLNFRMKGGSYAGILLKLMMNHVQLLQLISFINIEWSSEFKSYFSAQEYLSFMTEDLVPAECLIDKINFNNLTQRIIITNIFPIVFSGFLFVIWLLIKIIPRKKASPQVGYQKTPLIDKLRVSILLIITLFFPAIIRKALALLHCVKIDSEADISLLYYSPEIKCWESEHVKYILIAVVPGLLLWGLFVPLYIFYQLKSNEHIIKVMIEKTMPKLARRKVSPMCYSRKKEKETTVDKYFDNRVIYENKIYPKEKNPSQISLSSVELNRGILLKYLFRGYSSKRYYWEIFILSKN